MKRPLSHNIALLSAALALALTLATPALISAQGSAQATLTIDAAQVIGKVSPIHSGLMTEEINHAYDGGLYAELIQNRAFKDNATTPAHWSAVQDGDFVAVINLDSSNALNSALPVSLRLDSGNILWGAPSFHASATQRVGIANDGYWGFPINPSTTYKATFYAKGTPAPITASLESPDGVTTFAKAQSSAISSGWQQYTVTLTTAPDVTPTAKARFVLSVDRAGTIWFSLVSLFPPTFKDRPNGLRPDLMQMMADLKPSFLRFPGGNFLEGDTIETRFEWKKTIGPIETRPGHQGPWKYRSSDGMGMLEFLLWAQDVGAEPLLAVYGGYSLRGMHVNPGHDLEPFVQDALDEIEYVTGPASSRWGAQRAKDGHPEPFTLHYVEIGNEDWFDKSHSYSARFKQIADAIKAKYPAIKCISTVGFEQPADRRVTGATPDAVDEHYYKKAADFEAMSPNYYEPYNRKGPEIFVGEWAAFEDLIPWKPGNEKLARTPSFKAALGDACWMAAMERNSDIVTMQCYAPLFVNINPGGSQWRPDLIGYDALKAYGSPSYYAIKMFNTYRGDDILKGKLEITGDFMGGGAFQAAHTTPSFQYSATRDSKSGTIYLKLINIAETAQSVNINVKGLATFPATAKTITLSASSLADTNTYDEPTKITPKESTLSDIKSNISYTLPPYSLTVLQIGG